MRATLTSNLDQPTERSYSRATIMDGDDDLVQEPDDTLREAVLTHGAGAVLKSLARILRARRRELRREGELEAAKAARKASEACTEHGSNLSDAGV